MTTYQKYREEIARLTELAEQARKEEIGAAAQRIRQIMAEHGLTLADFGRAGAQEQRVKKTVQPVYRDPASDKTWTGRGRMPKWMEGKSRDAMRITSPH